MRIMVKAFVLAAAVSTMAISCKDRDAEKRIAELEAEVAAMKGEKKVESATSTGVNLSDPNDAAKTEDVKPEGPLPVARFNTVEYDFGTIKEGDQVEHTFEVKNTGEAPLIISKASPSCGCTVPDWTKTPIPAGGTGFVKAKFDSSGKPGMQNKTITVTANTWPKQTVLRFKAMVTPKTKTSDVGPVK